MIMRGTALVLLLALTPALAAGQKKGGVFRDPEDGRLDMSEWLLTKKGFLPIPIIITEPALGYGGGLVLAFFSQPLARAPWIQRASRAPEPERVERLDVPRTAP